MKKKDPALLFYTKDFYEGTRMMLPEERACYIDLMIYQHQNGFIPNDERRLLMYCSGVTIETLKATLTEKFKLGDDGWFNEKLLDVVKYRTEYKEKQSDYGLFGMFLKKAKNSSGMTKPKYEKTKKYLYEVYGKERLLNDLKSDGATHEATLKGLLKHIENANTNGNGNENALLNNKEEKPSTLVSWLNTDCKTVQNLKEPLNNLQGEELLKLYPKKFVSQMFLKMENWSKIKNNKSAYLTFLDWAKRDYPTWKGEPLKADTPASVTMNTKGGSR